MCSILGGTKFDSKAKRVFELARDRGRDYTGLAQRGQHWVANHRATPTNELEAPVRNQPFNVGEFSIVHNGTIANDVELGAAPGEMDSETLARVLDCSSFEAFVASLQLVQGSYAVAAVSAQHVWLAANYKPIFYTRGAKHWYFSSLAHHLYPVADVHCLKEPVRLRPYTAVSLLEDKTLDISRTCPDRALVVCSGGLDSTALCGYVTASHTHTRLLHFDYGCKATSREIAAVERVAKSLDCEHDVIKLDYSMFVGGSTLFGKERITTGKAGVEYALDWVCARNTVLLALATAYAEANNFGHIYLGANLEESGAYPDNEYQYILDMNRVLDSAVNNGYQVELHAPLGGLMKRDIVNFGVRHGSPLEHSWSCYNDGELHCGRCGPCYMRRRAFHRAGVKDPTQYEHS